MATHYSILDWRIPWTGEPDRLPSMGLQGVRHNWATNTFNFNHCNSLFLEKKRYLLNIYTVIYTKDNVQITFIVPKHFLFALDCFFWTQLHCSSPSTLATQFLPPQLFQTQPLPTRISPNYSLLEKAPEAPLVQSAFCIGQHAQSNCTLWAAATLHSLLFLTLWSPLCMVNLFAMLFLSLFCVLLCLIYKNAHYIVSS